MWRTWTTPGRAADLLALQLTAERAGLALACPFSSSEEFETAVVKSMLDAGIYGPKRRRRYALYAGATAVALIIPFWII